MIKLLGIYTLRDTPQPYYWDIVFEWEDQLSKSLNIPLLNVGTQYDKIYKPSFLKKILNRLNAYQVYDSLLKKPEGYYLAFHIGPPGVYSFHSARNVIPIIIDFWKHENLKRLQSVFSLSTCVFITSREVYHYLLSQRVRLPIKHLALSLPDKYLQTIGGERDIDVIQIGRSNNTLESYMHQFLNEHAGVHYVYARKGATGLVIHSNQHGDWGQFKSREDFISLLRRSKVSLVSAPGLDDDQVRTGGFSPVTPRFLESAACGCGMIGIYPDNDDFKYYKIDDICVSVRHYHEFKEKLMDLLSKENFSYDTFLQQHVTSRRAEELKKELSGL
jgi:hypothetical protein